MRTLSLLLILMTVGCGGNHSQPTPTSAAAARPQPVRNETEPAESAPVGCYADLAMTDLADDRIIVFIPSLRSVIEHHEHKKGTPLTESEVLACRDQALAVALPESAANEIVKNRGYIDIDPEDCWNDWQALHGVTPHEPPPQTNDTASPPSLDASEPSD